MTENMKYKFYHEKESNKTKKNRYRYRKFVLTALAISTVSVLGGCSRNIIHENISEDSVSTIENKQREEWIEVIPAEWNRDTIMGADMPSIDYAADDTLIFHGSFGLFIYDLNNKEIKRSINLKEIKCNSTQGDAYCEVDVSKDGNLIQMHPSNNENMYVYNVSENSMYKTAYCRMEDSFQSELVDNTYKLDSVENPIGGISYKAVKFEDGEYGYLHCEDGTLGTLKYICGDSTCSLFY